MEHLLDYIFFFKKKEKNSLVLFFILFVYVVYKTLYIQYHHYVKANCRGHMENELGACKSDFALSLYVWVVYLPLTRKEMCLRNVRRVPSFS